ncbi:MAG: DNA-binding XRE family transcriptional regulator [Candidatus Latescibacterota bacterium]|jgi:DNA-binding XRE family transcriptional regulator
MNTKAQYGVAELEKGFGSLTFGNALASYRLGEEKSQREFAAFLDISPQSLCDIEKERRIPSPSRAAKIARKLQGSVVLTRYASQRIFEPGGFHRLKTQRSRGLSFLAEVLAFKWTY